MFKSSDDKTARYLGAKMGEIERRLDARTLTLIVSDDPQGLAVRIHVGGVNMDDIEVGTRMLLAFMREQTSADPSCRGCSARAARMSLALAALSADDSPGRRVH
jgi:hypothetical protein